MTVAELRELLADLDDNDVVILQKDGEGNGYSPLEGLWTGVYVLDSTWSGEAHLRDLDEEAIEAGFTEEDLYHGDDGQNAVILYPRELKGATVEIVREAICPFCEQIATTSPTDGGHEDGVVRGWRIECLNSNCRIRPVLGGVLNPKRADVIALWNARPSSLSTDTCMEDAFGMLADQLEAQV